MATVGRSTFNVTLINNIESYTKELVKRIKETIKSKIIKNKRAQRRLLYGIKQQRREVAVNDAHSSCFGKKLQCALGFRTGNK